MKPQVANEIQAYVLDTHTEVGILWRTEGDAIRCFACGHRCLIGEGKRGICKVRFNRDGELRVPFGYVAALQCDPVEKKPFFHVYPGTDALTFGMLGCDYHCSYCFTGDTVVVTNRGPIRLADAFGLTERVERTHDAEIAFPVGLSAVAGSGACRRVRAVFKHHYRGELAAIRPYYLPPLNCTPDHRVYATADPTVPPQRIEARHLTSDHYLVIPRALTASAPHVRDAVRETSAVCEVVTTKDAFLVPVRDVIYAEYDGDVYNMEVEEEHNYLAGFFLVSNCQNWFTSQALRDPAATASARPISADQLVALACRENARLMVSSYNEPLITAEWAVAVFQKAIPAGLTCAFVSNGNATPEALDYLRPWIRAYKVDLKNFDDRHYRTLGGTLNQVLETIRMVHERGIWCEVVTLVIPGFNDGEAELRQAARFLASVSRDIPWHVTAFHQDYRMTDPPNTQARQLVRTAEIGAEEGLRFVYAGNLPGRVGPWENTYCPGCRRPLIERYGYLIRGYHLTAEGTCPGCGQAIPGIWPDRPEEVRTGDLSEYAQHLPRPVR